MDVAGEAVTEGVWFGLRGFSIARWKMQGMGRNGPAAARWVLKPVLSNRVALGDWCMSNIGA